MTIFNTYIDAEQSLCLRHSIHYFLHFISKSENKFIFKSTKVQILTGLAGTIKLIHGEVRISSLFFQILTTLVERKP